MEKYDQIGISYNNTRSADPYLASRMLALLEPVEGGRYLDVGCGTGNYTRVLAKHADITGVDPSETMLEIARMASPALSLLKGHAEALPVEDGSMQGVVASLTMHHWNSLEAGCLEIARVCPQGKVVLFTSLPEQMEGYWLNHYFPKMMKASIAQMPTFASISDALHSAGFKIEKAEPYFVKEDLEDLFLYSGKQRPLLYLDETFRAGVSSFSSLANVEEVEEGIVRLKVDIATGEISNVMEMYNNELGDYLFLVASR